MIGLYTVFRKELTDHLSSFRFTILFIITLLASVGILYSVSNTIRSNVTVNTEFIFLKLFTVPANEVIPFSDFQTFVTVFIPLICILLVFDSVNSERNNGTMSRLVSQPIYRDAIINGKFLAGVATISIILVSLVLLLSGLGLRMIGIAPSGEEAVRLFFFLIVAIIYGAFWIGLSILFSVLFRQVGLSALTSVAIWIFFFIFLSLIAMLVSQYVAPAGDSVASQVANAELRQLIVRISPMQLFGESMGNLLIPEANMLERYYSSPGFALPNPLSFGQSLLSVWPHLVIIVLLTVVCFAISYVKFMREEIRSL